MGGLPGDFSTAPARLERSLEAWRCAWRGNYGTMMRDSSRLWSGDCGNWRRRNSMKRRERGGALVRKQRNLWRKTDKEKGSRHLRAAEQAVSGWCIVCFDV